MHVIVRGNNRQAIFVGEHDYRQFLSQLTDAAARYECRVLAYVLMTNHVHLMVQTGQRYSVAKLMQSLNTAYAMYVNRMYERVGHVFQGRYHSIVVERDSYALELTRYIHLNPVRAGTVHAPEEHPWSSYRAYAEETKACWVDCDMILGMVAPRSTLAQRRARYIEFVRQGLDQQSTLSEAALLARRVLGRPGFVARITAGSDPANRLGSDPGV